MALFRHTEKFIKYWLSRETPTEILQLVFEERTNLLVITTTAEEKKVCWINWV